MIKNIIEAIRKDEKFSFEKIIENNIMTDDEYFEFLKFVYIEGVPEVRTSIDSTDLMTFDNENFYMEEKEMIRAYLEDVKEKYELDDSNNSTLVEKNLNTLNEKAITISIGITQIHESDTEDSLYRRVDKLLYVSKRTGKNKVSSDLEE